MLKSKDYPWPWLLWPFHYHSPQNKKKEKKKEKEEKKTFILTDKELSKTTMLQFGSVVKNLPASAGDRGSVSGSEISPGEGNGNPLQDSSLENSMDRGAWQVTVYRIEKLDVN